MEPIFKLGQYVRTSERYNKAYKGFDGQIIVLNYSNGQQKATVRTCYGNRIVNVFWLDIIWNK